VPSTALPDLDPVAIVDALDAQSIRAAIAALDERRRALGALLRVACIRERSRRRQQAPIEEEVRHAN